MKQTKKDTQRCTQDIRSIPPSRYALPTDGRKVKSLCRDRRALLMQLASYANGDGTSIKVSVPELAKALGSSTRTIKRRLRELYFLGLVTNGEIDGYYHTRVRAIDIQKVINQTEGTGPDSQRRVTDSQGTGSDSHTGRVTDSQEKGDRFAEKGDRLTGKGDRLTDLSTITVTIPSPKPSLLTDADSENSVKIGFEDFGVGVESVLPDTTDPAKGRPSPPSPALRQFYIKGVGLTEGTSYQDAESRVREKREQYLIKKGGGQ